MQVKRPRMQGEQGGGGGGGFGGGGGGGGGGQGQQGGVVTFPTADATSVLMAAQPGEYRVVLSVGGREYTKEAVILEDVWFRR